MITINRSYHTRQEWMSTGNSTKKRECSSWAEAESQVLSTKTMSMNTLMKIRLIGRSELKESE